MTIEVNLWLVFGLIYAVMAGFTAYTVWCFSVLKPLTPHGAVCAYIYSIAMGFVWFVTAPYLLSLMWGFEPEGDMYDDGSGQ